MSALTANPAVHDVGGAEPPADLQAQFAAASRALTRRLDDINGVALGGAREVVGRFVALDEQQLREALERACYAELAAAVGRLRRKDGEPALLTEEAEALATIWARDGAPVGGLIELCRLWHRAVSDEWLEWLERAPNGRDWDPAAVQAGVRFFFDYFAGVAALLATAYGLHVETLRRARSQRQLHLVQDVLAGRSNDAPGIPYDLSATHTGFVVWGRRAAAAVQALRVELKRPVLVIAASDDVVWAWTGGREAVERTALRRLDRAMSGTEAAVAFGHPASGVDGFRQSHEQALEAQAVARALGSRLTLYEDVALEVLTTADPDMARRFVADELGPLSQRAPRTDRLRETLEAYFAASLNANATGARLGVHDQTVTYRLRRVEETIGHPIYQRRAELEVALRLARLLS